jgi:hypothetical protein
VLVGLTSSDGTAAFCLLSAVCSLFLKLSSFGVIFSACLYSCIAWSTLAIWKYASPNLQREQVKDIYTSRKKRRYNGSLCIGVWRRCSHTQTHTRNKLHILTRNTLYILTRNTHTHIHIYTHTHTQPQVGESTILSALAGRGIGCHIVCGKSLCIPFSDVGCSAPYEML